MIGPGMGLSKDTTEFFESLLDYCLNSFNGHVVIDADGLNCLAQLDRVEELNERFILTPHSGEANRLWGEELSELPKLHAQVVHKSSTTVVHTRDGLKWINPAGNNGMATAGSGDVLAGIIGGLSSQGISSHHAAITGTYLHGLAGDIARNKLTEYCLTASDLIKYLPKAFKILRNQ